jgi:hypothetical protein
VLPGHAAQDRASREMCGSIRSLPNFDRCHRWIQQSTSYLGQYQALLSMNEQLVACPTITFASLMRDAADNLLQQEDSFAT